MIIYKNAGKRFTGIFIKFQTQMADSIFHSHSPIFAALKKFVNRY
jgi:hypothetical protein